MGDSHGNVVYLGERECSLQRRHQKVIEEAPSPFLDAKTRKAMGEQAVALAKAVGYTSAGTVELIVDSSRNFYFLEMNTRLQVEHPVTEMITGIDLVQEQIRIADGQPLSLSQSEVRFSGHAIECRITAESPSHGFRPCPGSIVDWRPPEGPSVRVDSHCFSGYVVPPFYDSLLAKLITRGDDRSEAVERMRLALENFTVRGVDTVIPFLRFLLHHPDYTAGKVNTRWLEAQVEQFSHCA